MIKRIIKALKHLVPATSQELEYQYLAGSENHVDLEMRMRQIQRGEAPYQRFA